jgi:hypothetical protein
VAEHVAAPLCSTFAQPRWSRWSKPKEGVQIRIAATDFEETKTPHIYWRTEMGEAKRQQTPAGEKTFPVGKLKTTFRVGCFVCDLAYGPGGLSAQWSPTMPTRSTFSEADMSAYRRGRNNFLEEVAKAIGGAVLVLEAS